MRSTASLWGGLPAGFALGWCFNWISRGERYSYDGGWELCNRLDFGVEDMRDGRACIWFIYSLWMLGLERMGLMVGF